MLTDQTGLENLQGQGQGLINEVDGDDTSQNELTHQPPIPQPPPPKPIPKPAPKPIPKPVPKPSQDALADLEAKVDLEERLAVLETQAKEQTARLSETSLNSAKSEILGHLGLLGDSSKNQALRDAVSAYLQRNLTFNPTTMMVEGIDNTSLDEISARIVEQYKEDFLKLKRTSGARPNFARQSRQPTNLIDFHKQRRQEQVQSQTHKRSQ